MGKGSVSFKDKHSLFTIGLGSGDYNNLAIDESDLVIAVGYDLVEYSPSAWNRIEGGKKITIKDFKGFNFIGFFTLYKKENSGEN